MIQKKSVLYLSVNKLQNKRNLTLYSQTVNGNIEMRSIRETGVPALLHDT